MKILIPMHYWLPALIFLTSLSAYASEPGHNEPPNVIASIKPLHSLVAGIMQGIGEPQLLMNTNQSAHHYNLKPSERQVLSNAELIFWIGPGMESFMPRLLQSIGNKTQAISLLETNKLKLLAARHNHQSRSSDTANQQKQIDPHIWLDTRNLKVMIDEITQQLIRVDPENGVQYKTNNLRLSKKIIELRNEIHEQLKDKNQSFITYHDGYQYFEVEFNLNNVGFVSNNDEIRPSARHIQTLKQTIKTNNIQCIFYDAPFEPPLISTLIAGTHTQKAELDPTGINISQGEDNIFSILKLLAHTFSDCLSSNE